METSETSSRIERISQLISSLKSNPRSVDDWLELESLFENPQKRREILQGVLLIDPGNPQALQRLADLEHMEAPPQEVAPDDVSPDTMSFDTKPALEIPQPEPVEQAGPQHVEETLVVAQPLPETSVPAVSPETARKTCPFCGEWIAVDAVKCRFCGEFLDGQSLTEPAPAGMEKQQKKGESGLSPLVRTALIIFIVLGLITILALVVYILSNL
jgi:hypothetical protein